MTIWIAAPVVCIALAISAELIARSWIRRRTPYRVWPPGMRLELRQHPDVAPEIEPRVRFEINSDGERGAEAPRGDDVFRILIAGGSAAECYALDQPTSWPGVLQRLLNEDDALRALGARRVHVGNIARAGVSSPELDLIFDRVLPNYERLDLLIVMVGASTVYHWLEDGAPLDRPPAVVPQGALRALGARRVHVVNIARSGVSSPELDLIFDRVLPNYERLDLLIVMVGASTVYHWLGIGREHV